MITFHDAYGNIGDAATNTGYEDAANSCDQSGEMELRRLFFFGYTEKPQVASVQAMVLAKKVKDSEVKSTLVNIAKLLQGAKEFVVVQT